MMLYYFYKAKNSNKSNIFNKAKILKIFLICLKKSCIIFNFFQFFYEYLEILRPFLEVFTNFI